MPHSFARTVGTSAGSASSGTFLGPVLAAVAVTVGLVLLLPGDDDGGPAASEAVDPAGFVAAYERSRTAELLVESTFTRTFADGRELAYDTHLVQRPPDDVVVVGAGSASGRLGGRIVRCNAVAADAPAECIDAGPAPDYDEVVGQEVATLEVLVEEAYEVARDGSGCWILTLVAAVPTPPYGGAARFCFDEASGALRRLEVRRPEGVEVTEARSIATEVTDADLRVGSLGDPVGTG
jgi:hypothetical protein